MVFGNSDSHGVSHTAKLSTNSLGDVLDQSLVLRIWEHDKTVTFGTHVVAGPHNGVTPEVGHGTLAWL